MCLAFDNPQTGGVDSKLRGVKNPDADVERKRGILDRGTGLNTRTMFIIDRAAYPYIIRAQIAHESDPDGIKRIEWWSDDFDDADRTEYAHGWRMKRG